MLTSDHMNSPELGALDSDPGSFRDPCGRVFWEDGVVKRWVTPFGLDDYRRLMSNGLAARLHDEGLLVRHQEEPAVRDGSRILIPDEISTISYPYEWSFNQLKDAALVTLKVAKTALEHGMILKDASAFNIQFEGCRPIFIDTLSFKPSSEGPWEAYGQFCRHFLAPLMVLSKVGLFFATFWKHYIDGFPLDVASRLLPARTYLQPGAAIHIHLHARMIRKSSNPFQAPHRRPAQRHDRKAAILDSLESTVRGLSAPAERTQWQHYYGEATHYSDKAEQTKRALVQRVVDSVRPSRVIDFGGNIGEYSRIVTNHGIRCVCLDIDPQCVDANYKQGKSENDSLMLPLVMDLTNPSGGLGFANQERQALHARAHSDLGLALALVHHLRITGGIPLVRIACFLAVFVRTLVIEFVPKTDAMVRALLRGREDVFDDYTFDGFRAAFDPYFALDECIDLPDTKRTLCVYSRKRSATG